MAEIDSQRVMLSEMLDVTILPEFTQAHLSAFKLLWNIFAGLGIMSFVCLAQHTAAQSLFNDSLKSSVTQYLLLCLRPLNSNCCCHSRMNEPSW